MTSTLTENPFKTEYAVQMTCESCVDHVVKVLTDVPGVDKFDIDLKEQRVIVEGTAPPSKVLSLLRSTGLTVVVRGQGTLTGQHSGAAVCIFEPYTYSLGNPDLPKPEQEPRGLARFIQIDEDNCLIDVTVEGFSPGPHGIHIHESGNITQGASSTGDHYNPREVAHGDIETGHVGDLGNISVAENGWGDLVVKSKRIKVWDVIGRSMVIAEFEDDLGKEDNQQSRIDGNSGRGLIAGVVARSAGAFENMKRVCACSGKTLWEEARI